jgi:quercetin dioxygenase-like cupin family protein
LKIEGIGQLDLADALLSPTSPARAQDSPELIRPRTHPVKYDAALGAGVADLGASKLRQLAVTLIELPPGVQLPPQRMLAEEMIYIVSGAGCTLLWNKTSDQQIRYDWKAGDLLSPSLNAWRQHANASSTELARYIVISTAPLTRRLFQNPAFLTANEFTFNDRWKDSVGLEPLYVPGGTGPETVKMKVGHLLPATDTREMKDRGSGMLGVTIMPDGDMASNRILEMELREFTGPDSKSPSHRHFWETFYLILGGEGYAVLEKEGHPERRLNWKQGDVFLVEANEFHVHRPRDGSLPRFLQIKASGYFRGLGLDDYMMQNKPGARPIE